MKSPLASKTVWFNVVITLILIGTFLPTAIHSELLTLIGVVVAGIGNIVLRVWFTNTPILADPLTPQNPPTT